MKKKRKRKKVEMRKKEEERYREKEKEMFRAYLIFVIFLNRQNFWRIKFTPKKCVN